MKRRIIIALTIATLSSPSARADDLFAADGRVNVARTLTLGGKTLESVQLGERRPNGVIEIYHKGGLTGCSEAELPALWVKALARREAARLAAASGAQPPKKPGTIEGKAAVEDYRKRVGQCLETATIRVTTPVAFRSLKADGTKFFGELLGLKDGEILITDGKSVAWVKDTYFAEPRDVRDLADITASPQTHADKRAEAEERAWAKGRREWPNSFQMQAAVYRWEMKAWDYQYPAPGKPRPASPD